MGRNFDEELIDDRTFTIGGEQFTWRYLHWREFATVMDEETQEERAETEQRLEAEKKGEDWEDTETYVARHEQIVENICKYLDPSHVARFKDTMNDKSKEVGFQQIVRLNNWLLEQQSARPTTQPSDSTRSDGDTAGTSQERQRSRGRAQTITPSGTS